MVSRRSASIRPTQHPNIGTMFIIDCRSTKHRGHTQAPATRLGSIAGGSRHERSVWDNFYDVCSDHSSPLDGRRSDTALHLERIKQRSDWTLSCSTCDTVGLTRSDHVRQPRWLGRLRARRTAFDFSFPAM